MTSTNLVKVAVPATGDKPGKVTIYNNLGSVSVVADISGWYSVPGGAHGSDATTPAGPPPACSTPAFGVGGSRSAPVSAGPDASTCTSPARADVPPTGVSAVVLNVTAIHVSGPESYLTVFPSGTTRPLASNLNFRSTGRPCRTWSSPASGSNGQVAIYNNLGPGPHRGRRPGLVHVDRRP